MACVTEIVDAVNQCDTSETTDEIVRCVELVLGATSDCIVCICDVLGALAGDDDLSDCDPDGGNPLF